MKNVLICLLLLPYLAVSQTKIFYLNATWISKVDKVTEYKREIKKLSEKSYKHIDYKRDTVVVTGEVGNLDTEEEVNDFLIYVKSNKGKYLPKEFIKQKFFDAYGRFASYNEGKVVSDVLFKNNDTYFIQMWNKQGKECLINGTGQKCDDSEQYEDRKDYMIFKDSLMVENYTVRTSKNDTLYNLADKLATPQNGIQDFYSELLSVLKYPTIARYTNMQGTVYISFVVDTNGELTDFEVLDLENKKFKILETSTIKNIKKMKAWNPSIKNNRFVKAPFTLPIRYELSK